MLGDGDAVNVVGHADMFAACNNAESRFYECPDRSLGGNISVNSIADRCINLNLIDGGGFCFFFDHAQVDGDGVPDILTSFFKRVTLAVAAGKYRAVSIEAVVGLVYNNRVFHTYCVTYTE